MEEDKFKMDELIEQMKLMNSQMTEIKGMVHIMNERMGNIEKALEESIYDQHRTDYERKSARQIFQQNRQLLRRRLGRDRCPECPKSRGSEACPKCSPLNFCFLAEHGNSSDDATSKDMCPKCSPQNFCRDAEHGQSEESPAHKSSCVKCSPEYFGCVENPNAFRNPGSTRV